MSPDISIAWIILNVVVITITTILGIYRYRRGIWYRKLSLKFQAYLLWGIGGIALISSFYPYTYLYTEHLWYFESTGYPNVFWKIIKIRWGLFFGFFFAALLFMNLNAIIAKQLCPEPREFSRWIHSQTVSFHRTFFCGSILIAILFAVPMMSLHDEYILYRGQPKDEKVVPAIAEQKEAEKTDVDQEATGVIQAEFEDDEIADLEQIDTEITDVSVVQKPEKEALFFGKDVNFYLFSYPLHKAISLWIQVLFLVTCGIVGLLYNFYYRRDARSMGFVKRNIVLHGSILWLMLLALEVWRSHVYLWGKVYTKSSTPSLSKMYGLFYLDAQLAGSTLIYVLILLGLAAIVIINLFWRRRIIWYGAIAIWCVGYIALIQVYPRVIHYVNVQNDYLIPEEKYLQAHIESTRNAFDLNNIIRRNYEAGPATLELVDNERNREVLDNVQLWDRRILYDILRSEHNVRHHKYHPYTDIDRYTVTEVSADVDDSSESLNTKQKYKQVLIAAREIQPDPEYIGDRGNWRNRRLAFTHGYGVYVAPANTVDEKKSPVFWTEVKLNTEKLKNEAVAKYPELNITQPRIYYGELTNDYVIVNTKTSEYDYETAVTLASTNEETNDTETTEDEEGDYYYDGPGGVQLTGWFRRLCFAVRFLDFQILYNKEAVLHSDSRIMFWRKIGSRHGKKVIIDRISHIAPFLEYDPDPYIVIDSGQLWWIVDYYVTSKWYPSAQFYEDDTVEVPASLQDAERRYKQFNYIRNSGVAVVNAYTGKVDFYAVKHEEALMNSYKYSFPNLFKGFDEMPQGLQSHLRFPDYLTRIQANVYKDYHVTNARSFLQKGLQLVIPKEVYGVAKQTKSGPKWKDDQEMMPYYAMIKLPGEEKLEFVNMIPFTPYNKEFDMKAWMLVRCDAPHYGERIVYTFNNTLSIKGPKHIENLITSELSKEFLDLLTGNLVIRGGLYFIPLEEGIIYVESIYQKPDTADETEKEKDENPSRPILRDIVTAANDNIATDPDFSVSLRKAVQVGEKTEDTVIEDTGTEEEKAPTTLEHLDALAKAIEDLRKAYINEQNGAAQTAASKNQGKKKQNKQN